MTLGRGFRSFQALLLRGWSSPNPLELLFFISVTLKIAGSKLAQPRFDVDLKEIKSIIDLMKKNSLSEFELEEKDFKIKLKRPIGSGFGPAVTPVDDPELTSFAPLARPAPSAGASSAAASSAASSSDAEIKSPMIGTFYRSPSPDSAAYVEVGTEVGPDTVVCIIEAMKVMNEIQSELSGTIVECLVASGTSVEFGQPLFRVKVG